MINFAEIINDQLEFQKKDDRLYLINGANDGTSIYLTDEQYKLIDSVLTDEQWKPLPVDKWCKVFQVDPTKYKKNYSQQAVWQYGGATNICSAFCSLFGFGSSRRTTPGNRINNELLFINLVPIAIGITGRRITEFRHIAKACR